MPDKTGGDSSWRIREIDARTGRPRQVGTLSVVGSSERRAMLRIDGGDLTREWTHLGNADTLRRARALTLMALAPPRLKDQ